MKRRAPEERHGGDEAKHEEGANELRIAGGKLPSEISTNFIHDLHTNDTDRRNWEEGLFSEGLWERD
jgi:hypothetical protein